MRRREVTGSARAAYVVLVGLVSLSAAVGALGLAQRLPAAAASPRGRWAPTHPVDVHPVRLALADPAPPGDSGYAVLATQSDGVTPVSWDPCRPIHYVVRHDGAPPVGDQLLKAAITRVEAATGLVFVDDGSTEEPPDMPGRSMYQPARYGDRWAPVLVAWSDPAEAALMTGVLGRGGPATFDSGRPGGKRYVSGIVVLNRPAIQALLDAGKQGQAEGVVLHELGHLVGLDHVLDPGQVMFSESFSPYSQYMAGDLRGLARLGAGPCFRDF